LESWVLVSSLGWEWIDFDLEYRYHGLGDWSRPQIAWSRVLNILVIFTPMLTSLKPTANHGVHSVCLWIFLYVQPVTFCTTPVVIGASWLSAAINIEMAFSNWHMMCCEHMDVWSWSMNMGYKEGHIIYEADRTAYNVLLEVPSGAPEPLLLLFLVANS